MPSNKQYIDEAHELATKLDVAITTENLNNEKLAELVADLKAQLKAREEADEKPPEDRTPEPIKQAEPVKRPPFYVVDGKAITTKRGIKSDGQEITAADLAGGKEALDAFVKSGHVGKG